MKIPFVVHVKYKLIIMSLFNILIQIIKMSKDGNYHHLPLTCLLTFSPLGQERTEG